MLASQKQQLIEFLQTALAPIIEGAGLQPAATIPVLERPRNAAHGDIACNIALQLAKPLQKNPRELAQKIADNLMGNPAAARLLSAAEVAGSGFLNLRLAPALRQQIIKIILTEGQNYGKSQRGAGQKVMVEFVSANPTGPLHVGHGRQGALGDAFAAVLESQGFVVIREFYYNDAGVQIDTLAHSVQARAQGLQPGDAGWPETAYNGDYIADIAADFLARKIVVAKDGAPVTATGLVSDLDSIRQFAVTYLRHEQDLDLLAFGVHFDHYYLESSLYQDGKIEHIIQTLIKSGKTYEKEGALWLRTTDDGDDKDRVMRKSDGTYTYFVPDIAYHLTKWERGFTKVINVQGSDHHGTIARVRAGLQALDYGIPADYPDYVLHKMVTVMKNGAEVKISKRAGSYVTLRDLIEWSNAPATREQQEHNNLALPTAQTTPAAPANATSTQVTSLTRLTNFTDFTKGRDAVRFFLISRKADTEFVFDVDLALAQSDENPVYYIQYAHARICSVLAQWGGDDSRLAEVALTPLVLPRETALLSKLSAYPELLHKTLEELEPHHIAFYLRELAGELHSYYNAERVLVEDEAVKMARLALLYATRQVLQNGLALIGVSAPSRM